MQFKNSSRSRQPKSGDGTQDVRKRHDANRFGSSQEPQEEFTDDYEGEGGRGFRAKDAAEPEKALQSEGKPFDAGSGHDLLTAKQK